MFWTVFGLFCSAFVSMAALINGQVFLLALMVPGAFGLGVVVALAARAAGEKT